MCNELGFNLFRDDTSKLIRLRRLFLWQSRIITIVLFELNKNYNTSFVHTITSIELQLEQIVHYLRRNGERFFYVYAGL